MKKKLTNSPDLPLLGQMNRRADFLTVEDWANRLKVSKRTIFRMIDEGKIPPYDFASGKIRRWREETYQAWRDGGN
jgi:excisionase family DNA binding protein